MSWRFYNSDGHELRSGFLGPTGPVGASGVAGATGPDGLPGMDGYDGVDFGTWLGAWSSSTAYVVGDIVTYLTATYISILPGTNHVPPNSTYWGVLFPTNPAGIFTIGGTIMEPAGSALNVMVWRAPFACTVTNVRGHRKGGTGATINARKNQASAFLSSALSVTSTDAWMDGGTVQNTSLSAGDDIEIQLVTITGAVSELAIQVDLTRD